MSVPHRHVVGWLFTARVRFIHRLQSASDHVQRFIDEP
jgi:hypothetical protein